MHQVDLRRLADLRPLAKNPADTRLPRYRRDRFSVLGRGLPMAGGANVNLGYLRCESGKGNCSHRHPQWEIFIPLSGRWEILLEGGPLDGRHALELETGDLIVVPPQTFHQATNISSGEAWMMSLNPGENACPYEIHPDVIEELRAVSMAAREAARRGLDM